MLHTYPIISRNYKALLNLRGRDVANAYLWAEFYFILKDELKTQTDT